MHNYRNSEETQIGGRNDKKWIVFFSCFKQTVKKFIRFIYLLPTALIYFSENIYTHSTHTRIYSFEDDDDAWMGESVRLWKFSCSALLLPSIKFLIGRLRAQSRYKDDMWENEGNEGWILHACCFCIGNREREARESCVSWALICESVISAKSIRNCF